MKELKIQYSRNFLLQLVSDDQDEISTPDEVKVSWGNAIEINIENQNHAGLRLPQFGAICAIRAHWTVSQEPATIVMPTGTGKTETMIAVIVAEICDKTLIIVPSDFLRRQTYEKFMKYGILTNIKVISETTIKPVIAVLNSGPNDLLELRAITEKANVIVTTMRLLQCMPTEYLEYLNREVSHLIVDEAHHIAAEGWTYVKHAIHRPLCLQFTATPFRNDGKKIDGKIIYKFPLKLAQEQNYFGLMNYLPIFEYDESKSDESIAREAIKQLETDIAHGYDHIILVRADDKTRAKELYDNIYQKLYSRYSPVLIISGLSIREKTRRMNLINTLQSRILVCVDMFREGIDIPNLKIAAIHDKYKSLTITLQFIGRLARTASKVGAATIITNIANDSLSDAIKELYAQDSDWNQLLHSLSESAIGKETSFQEFTEGFIGSDQFRFAAKDVRMKISMKAYHTNSSAWRWENWEKIFDKQKCNYLVNEEKHVLVIVEYVDSLVEWTTSKGIQNLNWELHVVFWNQNTKTVYVSSTDKSMHDSLANIIFTDCVSLKGDMVFRSLHGINYLMLGTVGLKSAIGGPIRFRMFTGSDIENAISEIHRQNSYKSNVFGVGYDGHNRISIGCSYKGAIWSHWVESIDFWCEWCNNIGQKIQDESIDVNEILNGVLIPRAIKERPNEVAIAIEWPFDYDVYTGESGLITYNEIGYSFYDISLDILPNSITDPIRFCVSHDLFYEEYELEFNEENEGFSFRTLISAGLCIRSRRSTVKLADFFQKNPPRIRFADLSALEGNYLVPGPATNVLLDSSCITQLNWGEVNIRKESQGLERDPESIQAYMIRFLKAKDRFSVIFDDDGKGEIADIVCFECLDGRINIELFHCKYSGEDIPGARISDLYEVCGQAQKSVKWANCMVDIPTRLQNREARRINKNQATRFEIGDRNLLRTIKNKMNDFTISMKITIVQPGVELEAMTDDMKRLIVNTKAYLMDTYGIQFEMLCS